MARIEEMASRISLITPCLNQQQYLAEAIDSVLSQGYSDFEYFVVDGGSTDGTVDIIRKHEKYLTGWVSEPDRGQAHAINKGLALVSGDIIGYLNGDDFLLPGALRAVEEAQRISVEPGIVFGSCQIVDEIGTEIDRRQAMISGYSDCVDLWRVWWKRLNFVQPEVFWSRKITEKVGLFDESLHYVMDFDYWIRAFRAGFAAHPVDQPLAAFRLTPGQKSEDSELVADELLSRVEQELWDPAAPLSRRDRLRLQGEWLYQKRFLPTAAASLAAKEGKIRRWLRLGAATARWPQIFASEEFQSRLATIRGAIER